MTLKAWILDIKEKHGKDKVTIIHHYTRDEKIKKVNYILSMRKSSAAVRHELDYLTRNFCIGGIMSILSTTTVALKRKYGVPNILLSNVKQLLVVT